jgi:hypothetical protein
MKPLVVLLLGMAGWPTPAGAGPAAPVVAVFEIEDRTKKLKKSVRWQLTEYLATRMGEGDAYKVVPPADIRRRLTEQKSKSYKQCYDERCQIELGRELAASMTLATKLLHIGRKCQLTFNLYDLAKAATHKSTSVRTGCAEEQILNAVDRGLVQLGALPESAMPVAKGTSRSAPRKQPVGDRGPSPTEKRRMCRQTAYQPCVDRCLKDNPRDGFVRDCYIERHKQCRAKRKEAYLCGGNEKECDQMCANDPSPGTCSNICMTMARKALRNCAQAWDAYCPGLPACEQAMKACLGE